MDWDALQLQLTLFAIAAAGAATAVGSLMYSAELPEYSLAAGICMSVGLLVMLAALWSWKSRWMTGKANEWILVVRNGRMVKAGVGLTVFCGMYDTVVSFPSVIQKVSFAAEQVSKEVQGLHVSGFCIWSINRVDDGPFKAYRYLDGLSETGLNKANDNLARMCESIIRSAVASMTIDEVMRNRNAMRDKVKADMGAIVQGWGVWLETVEVTEVTVCSKSLFDDMQVDFRQKSRQAAELTKLSTKEKIEQATVQSNSQVSKMKVDAEHSTAVYKANKKMEQSMAAAENDRKLACVQADHETQASIYRANKQLEEEQASAENEKAMQELNLAAAARKAELEIAEAEAEEALAAARQQRRLAREAEAAEQELSLLRRRLAEEKAMGPASLARLHLETARDVYAGLPLSNVRLVNVNAGGGSGGSGEAAAGASLNSLLPGLMGIQAATGAGSAMD